ncbi:MAG TPA: hypothetical protein VLR27_12785 [Acidimicrobiales bacterium]|nr:hypothetical protein [Acidimicrobiales bacterium]
MSDSPPPGPPTEAAEPDDVEVHEGAALVQLSFVGTAALLVAAVAGVLSPDGAGVLTAWVSGVLFAIGVVLFLWGYAVGVVRSREEQITLGGLFFLSGTAPKVVRFRLRIAFAVQVAAAFVAASLRPYTAVAFAVLAPMLGLGAMAMWGARHGTFHRKDDAGPGR